MNLKKEIKREIRKLEQYEVKHRSGIQRAGALALMAVTLFSVTELGAHNVQKQLARRDVIAQPNITLNPAEKNETVRMPVKMDDGIRAVASTGA